MSDGTQGPTRADSDGDGTSVLQNLPRTRPQRASPRRAAARRSAADKTASEGSRPEAAGPNGSVPAPPAKTGRGSAPAPARARGAGGTRETARRAPSGGTGKRTARPAKRPKRSIPKLDEVPPQGYESEDDAATGAVRPPGGAELVLSAAEIAGELAKAALSRSERLVKGVLGRLPLS
ncbi:MAG TPA: hypothetical protein VHY83_09385 [Solirubrobacteraceae bacterium]|jgi:hypothetical protein|nr:hypothetical protein [Solirubrobacteraceae bacterium]